MTPRWLYVPVMTGLFVANVGIGTWFFFRIGKPGAWWWGGMAAFAALADLRGLLRRAPMPPEWQEVGAIALNVVDDVALAIIMGLLVALVVWWIRRRATKPSLEDAFPPEVRGVALACFTFSVLLGGDGATTYVGFALTPAAGLLMLLMIPTFRDMLNGRATDQ